MTTTTRYSYLVLVATLAMIGWFGLATPFITVFFSYFALRKIHFLGRKWLTIAAFLALVAAICLGLAYFVHQAITTLPQVADTSIPLAIKYAKEHRLELPFSDWDSLKEFAMDSVRSELPYLGIAAKKAAKQFIFLVIGVVIALGIFLNPKTDLDPVEAKVKKNFYNALAEEIAARFRAFYHCFANVMGAQMVISTINTGITATFITCLALPHSGLVIGATFICGFLPIIGNLISNIIIVGIGFTVSPASAISALIFLIVLHKLEYLLNSKIIGERIKNPVWLTLIGLLLGERFMGIAGMILAPVILHYIKTEASQIAVNEPSRVAKGPEKNH